MKRPIAIAAVLAVMLALPLMSQAFTSPTWNLNGTYTIAFTCVSGCPSPPDYPYSVNIATTSDATGAVTGTGSYINGGGIPTVTVTGQVTGWDVTLDFAYDDAGLASYNPWVLTGSIDQNGGMSGTAVDGQARTFTWQTTTGSVGLYSPRCDYGTYSKSVMVWSGFAAATGAVVTTAPTILESTRDYFLEASGTYFAGGAGQFDIEADAKYSQDAQQRTASDPWTDSVHNYGSYGTSLLDLFVDGVQVDWGAFNAGHRYTLDVTPTGAPLVIGTNIYDVYYPGNTGGLCVALYYKDDTGPITSAVAVTPPKSGSGTMETVTANVDDTTTGGSLIKSAEFSVGGGAWTPMAAVDGAFDEMAENVSATFTGPLDGGTYAVCVRGTDVMDNTGDAVCKSLTVYDAYAELSGTAGGLSGNGKSLAFSFLGWVATAGDAILGKVEVNYRILGKTCTYTPDANSGLTILSGVATLTNWHSSCAAGEYDLVLKDRDIYGPRGMVSVTGPTTTYNITLQNLVTGNVHVRDLTVGTVNGFFSAPDSQYYNGPAPADGLYGTGPIEFTWTNTVVTGGFWNEIVPPTTGTTYYNIVDGTAVAWPNVTLHFTRTIPGAYALTGSGLFNGSTFRGQMDGPYLFTATGMLIVS